MSLKTGLSGKVALVTGGGTGLGKAIALALANEGVHIAIASRGRHDETIATIRSHGVRAGFVEVDLANESQTQTVVTRTIEQLGGLDLLVCNAAEAIHEPIARSTTTAWQRTLLTDVLSTMWLCRSALVHMQKSLSGSILFIGSTTQYHYRVGESAYHVSKVALAAFAKAVAIEAAPIRANLIVPGRFPTELNPRAANLGVADIPLGRAGEPEEIGPAAVFLLSDVLAGYITGAELVVSGGLHLGRSTS